MVLPSHARWAINFPAGTKTSSKTICAVIEALQTQLTAGVFGVLKPAKERSTMENLECHTSLAQTTAE